MREKGSFRTSRFLLAGFLSAVLAVFLGPTPAYGQIVNATLSGSVTDQSGAAVPEANITATETETGTPTRTTSDGAGNYLLPSLRPGLYNLTVEKPGFKAATFTGIQLLVNQQARLDAQLQVGEVTTTVEVTGSAPLVESTTASVGTVIGRTEVLELPLNLRRYGSLATLVPGTTPDNGGFANSALGSPFSETSYAANGTRSASNDYLVDGVEAKNLTFGGFSVQPTPDAVQEFKLQTNIYSAAFGRSAGSIINLVTKSGTNGLHGSVYEFLRNDKLDARNFFATNKTDPVTGQDIPGSARSKLRRNQFGFALGGPIRKNKTFAFGNYEALRLVEGRSVGSFVPTAAQKDGIFSDALTGDTFNLCGAGGPANLDFDTGQLFDPATLTKITCPAGSANAGQSILAGTPIAGNIITNIDPVAQKILTGFPDPNRPGFPNFINQLPRTRNDRQFVVRVDHSISESDQLYARYMFGQSDITDPYFGYTALPDFGDTIYYRGQNMALGWTHTFGPRLLNEVRLGFARNYNIAQCESCPRSDGFMSDFGINNFAAISPDREGFPFFGFNNFAGVGDANYRPVIGPDMVEKFQDNLTWTVGKHNIVFGGDMQFWQAFAEEAPFSPHGQIFFNGQFSGLAGAVPDAGGVSDLADLLLGYPNNAARTLRFVNTNQEGGGFWSWYAQDDIKFSPNFSMNIGLRYEYRRPAIDRRNNYVTFVPLGEKWSGAGNATLVTAAEDAENDSFCTDPFYDYLYSGSGQCLVASSSQRAALGFTGRARQTLIFPSKRNFAPRLGITWRPTGSDKMIIRTGYGIFYDLPNWNNQHFVDNNPVFSPSQVYNTSFGDPPPLTNGLPTKTANIFEGAGVPPLISQFVSLFVAPDYTAPYFQQWSLGVSSQFSMNWALEVNYIGNKGTKLGNLHLFANQPYPGLGDLQVRRPYPDFNIMLFTTSDSNSNYHSLQVKLTKRFSHGLSFLTGYTWAHGINDNEGDEGFGGGIGNAAPQDDNNLRAERGRQFTDLRHRFVTSYIWELPFGSDRRYLNKGGAVNHILGGWQLSGIVSLQTGFPISVLSSNDWSNTGSTTPRPDRTCDGKGAGTVDNFFDTSCFTSEFLQADFNAGTPRFGDSGRNILDGPGYANVDLAFLKDFKMGERLTLQFRGEFFNLFNHPNFTAPNVRVGNPNIGKIGGALDPRDVQLALKLLF